jgi:hypothetical protein
VRPTIHIPLRTAVLVGATALSLTAGASSAGAAVVEGDSIEAFIGSDMVGTVGYPSTADVQLVRNGNVIATATDAGDTVLNHDSCWDGASPDVLPGDTVRAGSDPASMDSMVVQNISLDHAALQATPLTTTVPITGNAGPNGAVLRFRFGLEQPDRDHEADIAAGPFTTTTTINNAQLAAWPPATSLEALNAGNELTVSDPVAGGTCGPLAATGIGSVSSTVLNAASQNVTISGPAAGDITSVVVSINGTALPAITPSGGTWSLIIPASQLAEGDNEIVASFTGPSDPGDQTRTITKDTTAPGSPPGVTPGGGTYFSAQSVTLNGVEGGGTAYYTTDGSDPTTASTRYTGPIPITSSQTLKVVQYDAAGNRGPVGSHAYVITSPPAQQQQQVQQPAPIVLPAPVRIVAGTATNALTARGLRIRGSKSLRRLRRSGLRYTVRASAGTRFLLVRLVRVTRSGRRTRRAILQERIIEVRSGGTYAGRLNIGRRTRTGRYELLIAPAGADEDFAPFTRTAFRMTR